VRLAVALTLGLAAVPSTAQEPPSSWVDPDTGHRVVRLTKEPGSASLYFNQNAYTADRKRMLYTTPDGISVLDLQSIEAREVVKGRARVIGAGRRSNTVYYTKDGAVWVTDVDSLRSREIGELPPGGSVATVNADETLLAGTYVERKVAGATDGTGGALPRQPDPVPALEQPRDKGRMMEERLAARLPMALFTMDVASGRTAVIHRATDWLNHVLFSPTDASLLMFCHEGPWHKVDRIWTIGTDGTRLQRIHRRSMVMEIFGHEFWGHDGRTIWYDWQFPRGEDFWLAGHDVETGERVAYHLQRNEWSIHFNVSDDGGLFCGDGGDEGQVAGASDGRWIYLFRPERVPNRAGLDEPSFIRPGVLRAERLVNMAKHDYRLEPNVRFTPDRKRVVFRSNMFGSTYVFAVEVEAAVRAGTR